MIHDRKQNIMLTFLLNEEIIGVSCVQTGVIFMHQVAKHVLHLQTTLVYYCDSRLFCSCYHNESSAVATQSALPGVTGNS